MPTFGSRWPIGVRDSRLRDERFPPPPTATLNGTALVHRGAERLDDLLQPVQVTDGHVDVGGVGALAPTPSQQATLPQQIKQ